MSGRSGLRSWLAAAVAAAILCGLAVVFTSRTEPAPQAVPSSTAPSQGRPLGAITPAVPSVDRDDPFKTDAVTKLLHDRADAINRRDEQSFLAGLDPTADADFVTRQRALFTNLAGVPLDEWSYQLHAEDALDVSGVAASQGTDELWAPSVDLRYALRGADLVSTTHAMGYLFARRGERWYLRSDTALDGLGRRTWRGPWDFAPCLVTSTDSGIVLVHPGREAMAERLTGELDSSVAAVTAVWGNGWSQRVALVLPDNPEEMRALVGPSFPTDSVVAVAVADRVDTDRHQVSGQRVVLNPDGSRALSPASLRVVLRHEILHVAARAETVDGAPMWLLEGFADYVGYRDSGITVAQGAPDLADEVRRSGAPPDLPEDKEFRSRGRELDLAYQQAWSVSRFVAERYGENVLLALYRKLAAAGPVSATMTDDLLRQVLGVDRAGLIAGWRQYLVQALR
ncbi:MAG: hypothetical protein ACJ72N_04990 [Labedaea sp.]